MTREQKIEIAKLRADGYSYSSIGKKFGVSRQYIYQIMNPSVVRKNREERYIYPNIVRWMNEKEITLRIFAESLGVSVSLLQKFLTGKCSRNRRIIENLPAVTGLPFEVAFERKAEK